MSKQSHTVAPTHAPTYVPTIAEVSFAVESARNLEEQFAAAELAKRLLPDGVFPADIERIVIDADEFVAKSPAVEAAIDLIEEKAYEPARLEEELTAAITNADGLSEDEALERVARAEARKRLWPSSKRHVENRAQRMVVDDYDEQVDRLERQRVELGLERYVVAAEAIARAEARRAAELRRATQFVAGQASEARSRRNREAAMLRRMTSTDQSGARSAYLQAEIDRFNQTSLEAARRRNEGIDSSGVENIGVRVNRRTNQITGAFHADADGKPVEN